MADLNPFLQPVGAPVTTRTFISGYEFNSQNERGAVTSSFIRDFSFNSGQGGTLTLGGTGNVSGVLSIKDEGGTERVRADSDGLTITGGNISIENSLDENVMDGAGVVNSTLMTNSAITTAGDIDQVIGTTLTPLTGGTINFSLDRSNVCLFLLDAQIFAKRTSGTADYNAFNQIRLYINDVERQSAVTQGAFFDSQGVRGAGEQSWFSNSIHTLLTLGSGSHTFVAQGIVEQIQGTSDMTVNGFDMSFIRVGT